MIAVQFDDAAFINAGMLRVRDRLIFRSVGSFSQTGLISGSGRSGGGIGLGLRAATRLTPLFLSQLLEIGAQFLIGTEGAHRFLCLDRLGQWRSGTYAFFTTVSSQHRYQTDYRD